MERPVITLFTLAHVLIAAGCGTKDPGDSSASTAQGQDDGNGDGNGDGGGGFDGDPVTGEAIYSTSCSACHGVNGEGGTGPGMDAVVPGMSGAELQTVVMEGSGSMPPILTSETDAADVAAYCLETWGP